MRVFVLNPDGRVLITCKPHKAKKMLKSGKAKVVKRNPFTIQLVYGDVRGFRNKHIQYSKN